MVGEKNDGLTDRVKTTGRKSGEESSSSQT